MLKFRKMLAGLVGITMTANLLATMPYSAFADDSDSRTYTYEHYEVTYNVTNSWGGTDVVSVTLSNIGDTTIENWMLYFDPNGDIQYVNDATQAITSGGTAYIKNAGYNANVDANASVTFSYAVNDCEVAPDDFVLCQTRVEKESGYEVNLKVNESWGDSFNGEIILQNNTDAPIEAWELMIDTNFTITEITNSWAATVTELEPYSYLLKGTYTGTVYANSSVSLGFVGVKNGEPEIISDSLTEVVIDEDMINNVTYEDEFYDDCIDWSTVPDSDEDGLPDDLEEEYGCDPENPDTDGDGLPDGYEILTIGSNPADVHSLDSTLSDGEYDNDQDGLSNYEEYLLGTDPLLADSDFDGLSDGEEVNVYGTDPLNSDTDGDGLSDGDEVALGLNPLVVDSNGDGVLDSKEKFSQSKSFDAKETDAVVQGVDVAFEGTGYIHSTTTVESVMDVDWMCSNVVGLIGEPYDISSESTISTGTITFHIDQLALDGSSFDDLAVLWYNEEEQRFVEMETVSDADNSTLTVTTEHFSKYLIVDCSRWYEAWSENNYPTNGNTLHTAITIDCSDSMNWNDPEDENGDCYRKTAANGFVDTMHYTDKASVILFHEDSILKQELTNDKDLLKTAISQIFENGYTNYDSALRTAIDSLEVDNNSDAENIIIFLSDGVPTDNTGTEVDEIDTSLVDEARMKNIRIYTIGLTSNAREDILTYMAEETGGEYYHADTAQELVEYFLTINMEEKYDITTDTDGDGLPDLFETYGMPVANGQVLFSDPTLSDTDDDGLDDGEEVIMHIVDDADEVKAAYNYMYHYIPDVFISDNGGIYFEMVADPDDEDTDGDGIIDGNEMVNITADPRYDNLNPVISDTIWSLFPELTDPKGVNQENNAVYIRVDEKTNHITIKTRILFDDDYNNYESVSKLKALHEQSKDIINRIGEEYTLEDLVVDGIEQRWGGEYMGSIYDFYPGMTVSVTVDVERLYEPPKDPTLHYTTVHCLSSRGRAGTKGGMEIGKNKEINMYIFGSGSLNKTYYELVEYEAVAAHEFGHTLLLSDAYPDANSGYAPVSSTSEFKEIYYNNTGFNSGLVGSGEIMYVEGDVLGNDIEMMLVGYSEGEWQRFVPSSMYSISEAIKEPQIYIKRTVISTKYYIWDEKQGFLECTKTGEVL